MCHNVLNTNYHPKERDMFYAFDNKYGINTRSADSNDRIGKVTKLLSKGA